jgi:hypothetical protein
VNHLDYDGRVFRSVTTSPTGDVGAETLFHYRQQHRIVWATYSGGAVSFGTLIARVLDDGRLDMRYQHVSTTGAIKTGRCVSTPETLADGRVRLNEEWKWTEGGTGDGVSQVEEVRN